MGTRHSKDPGQELLFGMHAVRTRLARAPDGCERLLLQEGLESARLEEVRQLAEAQGVAVERVGAQELRQLTGGRHQGVAMLCAQRGERGEPQLAALVAQRGGECLLLILDGVTDPQNLGACLRSAAAMGVDAVVVPRDRSASLTPAARKVASGGAELVPLIRVTNLARTLAALKEQGVWSVGLGAEAAQPIGAADLTGPVALVLGSEGAGLRRLTERECDLVVRIPQPGSQEAAGEAARPLLDSLNVSVAAGIALYEVTRQRAAGKA